MKTLMRTFLSANRKHRCLAVKIALWLIKQTFNVEMEQMRRCLSMVDEQESERSTESRVKNTVTEEDYSTCEHALGFLDCAITDLEFAY